MSRKVAQLVYSRRVGSAVRKAVLAYCADKASDDGTGVWASKHTIAKCTEVSLASVKREMRQLEEMGILIRAGSRPCSRGETVVYDIDLRAIHAMPKAVTTPETTGVTVNPVQGEPGSGRYGGHGEPGSQWDGVQGEPSTGVRVNPKPSLEPSLVVVVGRDPVEPDLDDLPFPDADSPPPPAKRDGPGLRERVMAVCRVPEHPLPKWWLPPRADLHVHRWIKDLGLTEAEILSVAEAASKQHAEIPEGPKALDRYMQALSAEKTAPPLEPKGTSHARNTGRQQPASYAEIYARAREGSTGDGNDSVLTGQFAPGASRHR